MPKFETWKLDRSYTLRPGTKTVPRPTLLKIWNIHEALMAKKPGATDPETMTQQQFKKGKLLRQEFRD